MPFMSEGEFEDAASALRWACRQGHTGVVKAILALLAAGPSTPQFQLSALGAAQQVLNLCDEDGSTPVLLAVRFGRRDIKVQPLLFWGEPFVS